MNINKIASVLFILMASITILIVGQNFIIPIVLAVLIWFLIKELRTFFSKLPLIGKKIPKWLLTILSTLILFVIFGIVINILADNFNKLSNNIPSYEKGLEHFNDQMKNKYNLDFSSVISNFMGKYDFSDIIKQVLNSLTNLFSNALLIGFYVLFMFFEETIFTKKLASIYKGDSKKYAEIKQTLSKINDAITTYVSLKTLVSIITGILSYIALVIIGIDTPFFWAFLIFILNYIPTVGSLVATIFPATIALLQFGDLTHFFITLSIIGSIQLVIGNFIEPKLMGNSLNISSFVVILSLTFWGIIWGITGMFLSVPITVILIILFAQFKTTKPIAVILSDKGEV
jgi:predicted PurR-regulated permease PerM